MVEMLTQIAAGGNTAHLDTSEPGVCVCVADACCSIGAAREGAAGGPRESGGPATGQTHGHT